VVTGRACTRRSRRDRPRPSGSCQDPRPCQDGYRPGSRTRGEVLAFTAFPRPHWRKIWSTNPLERVNKEIKRRSRVVGAILIDMHDEWIAGDRRYLSEGSMAKLYETSDTGDIAAIEGGE
jgi:hypothetical protein